MTAFAEPATEGRDKAEMYRKGMSQKEATVILNNLLGNNNQVILQNAESGEEVRLSKRSIGKLLSNAAEEKSIANGFERKQHYAAVSDIDNLFANSVKIMEHPDKNNTNYVFIHRYVAPLYFDNSVAYITVKETREPKQSGKRIYSAELIEIKKLGGKLETVRKKSSYQFPNPEL